MNIHHTTHLDVLESRESRTVPASRFFVQMAGPHKHGTIDLNAGASVQDSTLGCSGMLSPQLEMLRPRVTGGSQCPLLVPSVEVLAETDRNLPTALSGPQLFPFPGKTGVIILFLIP